MPLYTFYLTRPDGLSNTFETFELEDQREAEACATRMLEEHLSAASVVAYRDQTQVITRRRPEPCSGPDSGPAV